MSQKQTLAPLEKLISYFAGYDSLAHFTPSTSVEVRKLALDDLLLEIEAVVSLPA